MNLCKQVLGSVPKCYAALGMEVEKQPRLVFAGEGAGMLKVFSGDAFEQVTEVWRGGGGTMSIVALPGYEGWFLASRGFYSMVESQHSTIEIVRFHKGGYVHEEIASLPYLHRFGIVRGGDGRHYLVAATIAGYKADKEDWSHPGALYYAEMPRDLAKSFTLTWCQLPGAYFINHGFCIARYEGREAAFIGCRDGVFAVLPPAAGQEKWQVHQLVDFPVSDLAVLDIDEDGKDELAMILPFHGNHYQVFRETGQGYEPIYTYPVAQDFYHTVIGVEICGQKLFIGGARRNAMQLFGIRWNHGAQALESFVIDEGVGPSGACVLNLPGKDILLSANRQKDEAAIYVYDKSDT